MSNRPDFKHMGARMGTLGTVIEEKGDDAYSTGWGWAYGPRPAPSRGERGGGGGDVGAEDQKAEYKQSARAAEILDELVSWYDDMDRMIERGVRLMAVLVPIHPTALRNPKTGDLDPVTPADVAAAGWCMSCWRNDQQMVPIEKQPRTDMRYYRDYCRWCGAFKAKQTIEPPLELLKMRHNGQRISEEDVDKAVKAAQAAANPKKSKRRKGKKAA